MNRRIRCHHLAGRRAELIVLGDCGRVVLVTAAGETVVLTPQQVGELRAALRDVLQTAVSCLRRTQRADRQPSGAPTDA